MDLDNDVTILLADFDRSLLPDEQQNLDDIDFSFAVVDYLKEKYRAMGKHVLVRADLEKVVISPEATDDNILKTLNAGNLQYGIELCDERLERNPHDTNALYNSAMALSDLNQLGEAVKRLQTLLSIGRKDANVYVALGVAYSRQGENDEAINALERALGIEPSNPYALRNIARLYTLQGHNDKALGIYKFLAPKMMSDPAVQLGFGEALRAAGLYDDANRQYNLVIEQFPATHQAQLAKDGKNAIVATTNSSIKTQAGGVRQDAVACLMDAMGTYDGLSDVDGRNLFFEVAMEGQKGFHTDDATQKYTLKAMPGKKYSGFQLVCYMYAGSLRFLPDVDHAMLGIDLSAEYAEAERLYSRL